MTFLYILLLCVALKTLNIMLVAGSVGLPGAGHGCCCSTNIPSFHTLHIPAYTVCSTTAPAQSLPQLCLTVDERASCCADDGY